MSDQRATRKTDRSSSLAKARAVRAEKLRQRKSATPAGRAAQRRAATSPVVERQVTITMTLPSSQLGRLKRFLSSTGDAE